MEKEKRANYISVINGIMMERGLSQSKLAKELGVNQTTISQWLLGNKKPNYDNILTICVKFGITPNDFFGL